MSGEAMPKRMYKLMVLVGLRHPVMVLQAVLSGGVQFLGMA